ncbi:MAG: dephospho-CoA kinase [Candidatus Symbiothrix sp.]|jgi:dephospho-CoA kinase|nr:dephospho-CoA kinase [Candidatus Symbiothrix sp.]
MKVLGITGGIGSGKSVVSKLLEIQGIPVYNTDKEAKKITAFSLVVQEKLSGKFGAALYKEGVLDKAMLASLIFNHPEYLAFTNSVIHPEVQKDFEEWKERQLGKSWVGIESAILFESGFDRLSDECITVSAPLEIRIQRVQKRDGLNRDAVLSRLNNQLSDKERSRLANCTIVNDEKKALLPQVENLLKMIKFQ